MGLFDQLKNIAMKEANNLINEAKEKASDKIADEVREQSTQVISDGVNTYLENAKEKVDTQEGKEAVERLQNLVQDQKEISNAASSLDSSEQDAAIKITPYKFFVTYILYIIKKLLTIPNFAFIINLLQKS